MIYLHSIYIMTGTPHGEGQREHAPQGAESERRKAGRAIIFLFYYGFTLLALQCRADIWPVQCTRLRYMSVYEVCELMKETTSNRTTFAKNSTTLRD